MRAVQRQVGTPPSPSSTYVRPPFWISSLIRALRRTVRRVDVAVFTAKWSKLSRRTGPPISPRDRRGSGSTNAVKDFKRFLPGLVVKQRNCAPNGLVNPTREWDRDRMLEVRPGMDSGLWSGYEEPLNRIATVGPPKRLQQPRVQVVNRSQQVYQPGPLSSASAAARPNRSFLAATAHASIHSPSRPVSQRTERSCTSRVRSRRRSRAFSVGCAANSPTSNANRDQISECFRPGGHRQPPAKAQ